MARGWESKSVEDQIETAEVDKQPRGERSLTPQQRERQSRRQSLLLSRAQTLSRLKATANPRYRAQLELALKHLDEQLRKLQ